MWSPDQELLICKIFHGSSTHDHSQMTFAITNTWIHVWEFPSSGLPQKTPIFPSTSVIFTHHWGIHPSYPNLWLEKNKTKRWLYYWGWWKSRSLNLARISPDILFGWHAFQLQPCTWITLEFFFLCLHAQLYKHCRLIWESQLHLTLVISMR